jgi:hypothetical protein
MKPIAYMTMRRMPATVGVHPAALISEQTDPLSLNFVAKKGSVLP